MKSRPLAPLLFSILLSLGACAAAGAGTGAQDPRYFGARPGALPLSTARLTSGDNSLEPALAALVAAAEKALAVRPPTVMDKIKAGASGDKHDYASQAPYLWPDPSKPDGLPYIVRDGVINPESRTEASDKERVDLLGETVGTLALAYHFTGTQAYAEHAARCLRVWFLDRATLMNPNFNQGQAVPGRNTGRNIGIIEIGGIVEAIDASSLLAGSDTWTESDVAGLTRWATQFLDWLVHSPMGIEEAEMKQNHGTIYDVNVVRLALHVGQVDLARRICEDAKTRRIAVQIEPDGSQPMELRRTKSFNYSRLNLRGLCALAVLGERVGVNLWSYESPDGRSIRKALEFMYPYVADASKPWPFQQIVPMRREELAVAYRQAAVRDRDTRYEALASSFPGIERARHQLLHPALGAAPAVAKKSSIRTPNVLLIIADDLNVDLGCYGNAEVKSPNIDRLAARGVRFDRAYCQYPLCNPSRVSFLSGRRPETSGVYVLSTSARKALPEVVMMPQYFRERGYFTAGVGKVFHSRGVNDERSWDFYEDGPGNDPQELDAIQARYVAGGGDGRPAWHVLDGDGSETRDGLTTRSILRMMSEQRAAGRPFFLAAGFHKPHLPWTAPRRFFELYPEGSITIPDEPSMRGIPPIALQTELSGFAQPASRVDAVRGYYACISFIDAQVGLLLDELDRRDLWENTVVVLMSDNGFHLGDHGGLWAKLSAFDAATRVPLIIAGAGVASGKVASAPVELIDVYPTLLELSGFAPDPGLEGVSLLATRAASGVSTERPAHSMVFHYDVATGQDVLGRTAIAEAWRYTEWSDAEASREFYRRACDPHEYHNLVGDPALTTEIDAGRASIGRLPTPKPGPSNRPRALVPPGQRVN